MVATSHRYSPRYAYQTVFSSRWFLILFLACFIYPIVSAVMIYLPHNAAAMQILEGLKPGEAFNILDYSDDVHRFATKPVIKKDAETAIRKIEWVTHVVNKVEELPVEPAINDLRGEVLSMVKKASPQSFPQDRAYIRVKIDGGMNVTLVGWADPIDKVRLDAAVTNIGIPSDRVVVNLDRYGNTSAASIPLVLDELNRQGRIEPGSRIIMSGYGAGLAWGTALLQW